MAVRETRVIAFYLPQYHPIPENDQWWGKGFTEWTNAVKARPLFPGHYQPHLPADLGFYDLRLPEVREAQAELARGYGIHGFCYYHYWFAGRRLLERPVNGILESGKPDFPFCLCWANEPWTRAWTGQERQILIEQKYSEEDDREHIGWLCRAFRDPRYIRINGRPLFLVYRVAHMPDPRKTAEIWREEAHRQGIGEIVLARVESWFAGEHGDPRTIGFDCAVGFQPSPEVMFHTLATKLASLSARLGSLLIHRFDNLIRIYDYRKLVETSLQRPWPPYPYFPCVTPMWDNSARRRSKAIVLRNSTPELFEKWVRGEIARLATKPSEEKILFVNAWNEWAEGSHLEPDVRHGRGYLEATKRALLADT
jgi:lipopolysaccharide biosynthesis protein